MRLAAARALGAEPVVDAGRTSPEEVVREWTDGLGADTVVECVGRPDAWAQAVSLARRGGEVLFFGGCEPGSELRLDTGRIHYDELVLRGGFHYTPASAHRAFELITERVLHLDALVSDTLALQALPDAFERVRRREVVKLAVRP
jgi:L-iditol 2-dehydrogenase